MKIAKLGIGVRFCLKAMLAGLLSLSLCSVAWAQPTESEATPESVAGERAEEPISTDRPDLGTSATTVGPGRVQIETGIQFNREDGQDFTTFPTLLRVGAGEHWEFRIESDVWHLQNPGVDSFSDVLVGAKVTLHDGETTKVGMLFNVNIPVGFEELRGTVDPELKLLLDQDLGGGWGVGINVGAALTEDVNETRFLQLNWATSFSHPITDKLAGYIEAFGEGPDQAGGHHYVGADTGLVYRVTDDFQLDVYYLRGLSGFGPEWAAGTGVSARF